ncbi:MAG: Eco57I restriction-modification methylase domain-containing protein [Selenomonadaceae bacterium]|nr:Eco57I restriction-modification methylase domain-containing protein [Selenomonadaceae bacterium]
MKNFYEVSRYKLIYVYAIPDDAHKNLLKIGETTISTDLPVKKLSPNSSELKAAAKKRIKDCTNTAGVAAKPLHAELAVADNGKAFGDREVHELLIRSGVKKKSPEGTTAREWFELDLPTAIQAIKAVKQGKKFLAGLKSKKFREEIILRPEQETAVNKTVKHFQHGGKEFLWNAKMRFGKTLCALEVVRQMNFAKTIIVTHRPVVDAGWFDDFKKIFDGNEDFIYGQKGTDVKDLQASKKNFVYFASIQDLRGSKIVGGKHFKNTDVFGETWDFVIVDEAHEGTQTARGDAVIKKLVKKKTKFLALSGTPFNLIKNFSPESIYTWDYVMEQHAKKLWATEHGDDPNPYADLPTMNILTYNLGELLGKKFSDDEDIIFSFKEFFRTDDAGNFVHEADVKSFLDLLVTENDSNYPFANEKFCNMFRHTLWRVPGVREAKALSQLLQNHRVFCNFGIANVAGDGDEDIPYKDALKLVQDTIAENDYSITISCGKLTTGVTVPQWTAVLYLAGNYLTSASSYLQTIFRVQTPCDENGVSKQNCYVFDFAPYRALRMLAASIKVSVRPGKTTDDERKTLDALLKFCPVIAVEGSEMKPLDAKKLLQRIKRAQAERIVQNGFDDNNLYNDTLRDLTKVDLEKFKTLKGIVGAKKSTKKIDVNDQGLTGNDGGKGKTHTPLTDEQKENNRKAQIKRDAILILRGLSIRMPLLIYGADIPLNEDFTLEMFLDPNIVDDASWTEFMPAGVTREFFKDFMQYYDPENFINAGRRVRQIAEDADKLKPTERVKKIAELFATFKNPDKETVLTPWRVVNLHMSEVFGGWNFFAENPPQFVPTEIFTPDKKILEINSKTGLYPLYVVYSIYRARLGETGEDKTDLDELQRLWDSTVSENVFVICKTPMAKTITRRTLLGYRAGSVNAEYYGELITELKNIPSRFINRITEKNFWNKGAGKMFFDAVVGNPPYQTAGNGDNKNYSAPIYHEFLRITYQDSVTKHASLIHPARFLSNAGTSLGDFNQKFLNNEHIRVVKFFLKSQDAFPTSDIKGGVAITEFDATKNFEPIGTFFRFEELKPIHQKVCVDNPNFKTFSKIMFAAEIYHFTNKMHEDFPDAASKLSTGHAYDLKTSVFEKLPKIFFDTKPNDGHEYIQILGLIKSQRVYKWIRRDYINDPAPLTKYKVLVPKSNGSGALGEVVSTPLVGSPLVGNTQTFITVGAFDTEAEARACKIYIETKFCRVMLGILKVTQDNPPATWAKVPLQDFTPSSDIDWSKPVAQIDEQLYRKYNLTEDEINFIKSKVKSME